MFWTFCVKKQEKLWKQKSTCPEDHFSCWTFKISPNLYIFCTYSEKQFARTLGQTCQKCTCIDHGNILRKTVPLKLCFFCFWDIEWIFLCLMAKEAYGFVKTSFYAFRRTFTSLLRLKNAQMFNFFVLTAKTNLQKLFGRFVDSMFVLSTVTFWGKLVLWRFVFFWDFECKFYPLWQKLQRGCQNFI